MRLVIAKTYGMTTSSDKIGQMPKMQKWGAYHFFDMRDGSNLPKEQARYFLRSLLKEDMGELRRVMDFGVSPG